MILVGKRHLSTPAMRMHGRVHLSHLRPFLSVAGIYSVPLNVHVAQRNRTMKHRVMHWIAAAIRLMAVASFMAMPPGHGAMPGHQATMAMAMPMAEGHHHQQQHAGKDQSMPMGDEHVACHACRVKAALLPPPPLEADRAFEGLVSFVDYEDFEPQAGTIRFFEAHRPRGPPRSALTRA